jgi:hypothetical protein
VARRAAGRLYNLSICSQLGSCITHRRGRLSVENCSLNCEAEGLDHLISPIATWATSPPAQHQQQQRRRWPARSRQCRGDAQEAGVTLDTPPSGGSELHGAGVGPGLLSVVESKIKVSQGRATMLSA